ncbi:MAG: TonB-dependent receptor plug domain-containing protein [Bacteroidota bacterium]
MLKISLVLVCFLLVNVGAFAQGTIRGEVKDASTGKVVPFAKIKVEGQNNGAMSDFEGLYSLKIAEGKYILLVSAPELIEQKHEVLVKKGEVIELNFTLKLNDVAKEIEGATVVAYRVVANTIAGDDARRREATNATDGISKEQMKASGDGDVGEVAQRVTGVSVENGKHVYVRGLGDRYTKTILNGMEIPGLDPERNTVQMDVFPTNLIDNVTVYKTFTPNLAGDFTGGLIDISTKDFPSKKSMSFSSGFAFNTETTFNPNYISYEGGKTDFLGFDDGTRKLPIGKYEKTPDPTLNDPKLSTLTKAFNQTMATEKAPNFLDQNYSFSLGNQINKEKFDYGYNFVANYKNSYKNYDSVQFNEYRKDSESSINSLNANNKAYGQLSENDVLWTTLLGQSLKINKKHKFSLILFHTQNGKKSASNLRSENFDSNPSVLVKQSLQYNQRSITNALLSGSHNLKKWKIDWKLAPTVSSISDPDIRSTILEEVKNQDGPVYYDLNQSVGGEIRRIFRDLKEYNVSTRLDFKYNFTQWDSLKSELSFGVLNTFKARDFEVNDYLFNVKNPTSFSADPNFYFQEENIWTSERNAGTYVKGEKQMANTYNATQNVLGVYVMNDLPLSKKFNVTYGARIEKSTNTYTGQNNSGSVKYNKQTVLDELSVLPAVNMVYKIKNKNENKSSFTNLRSAFATTVARPSFRENSVAQIYDPIQGRRFNGNIDLKQTTIHNADLRFEHFFGRTEIISASAFYKRFINPIEIVSFDLAPNEIKPVNAGVADVYGAELEIRKAIGFKAENKKHLSFVTGCNFTYVISKIDMRKVFINKGTELVTEKSLRQENARDGETIGNYRAMYGQSPYVVNAFATFKNDSIGLTFNASYNVQGKRLAVIGVGRLADVYEQPFHSLNVKVSKDLGKTKSWNASLAGQNLLFSKKRKTYESFNTDSMIYDYYRQGLTVTGTITYTLK